MTAPTEAPARARAYTVAEAAAVLSVSPSTVYAQLGQAGEVAGVRGIRIGRSWRLPKDRIDALVAGE